MSFRDEKLPYDIQGKLTVILTGCSLADESKFREFSHRCESPIEKLAFASLFRVFPCMIVADDKRALKEIKEWTFACIPQMAFKGYRLDFGVLNRREKRAFALECDGRGYHDHRRDCERSLNIWEHKVQTFRVSGSALMRDAIVALEPFGRLVRGLP